MIVHGLLIKPAQKGIDCSHGIVFLEINNNIIIIIIDDDINILVYADLQTHQTRLLSLESTIHHHHYNHHHHHCKSIHTCLKYKTTSSNEVQLKGL